MRGLLTEPERGQEELPATTCRGAGMGVRAYLPTWLGGEAPKPKKKICCACPATKAPRDECIAQHGEEHCAELIEAHKRCLRAEGFKV